MIEHHQLATRQPAEIVRAVITIGKAIADCRQLVTHDLHIGLGQAAGSDERVHLNVILHIVGFHGLALDGGQYQWLRLAILEPGRGNLGHQTIAHIERQGNLGRGMDADQRDEAGLPPLLQHIANHFLGPEVIGKITDGLIVRHLHRQQPDHITQYPWLLQTRHVPSPISLVLIVL